MKVRIITIVLFILLLPLYGNCAQIHFDKEIENIPANVTDIYSCGYWEYGGNSGYYRIIYLEFFRGCSLVFVQWMLRDDAGGGSTKVKHTLSIKEFNADDHIELIFDKPICKPTPNGIDIEVDAESGHDLKKRRIKIQIFHKYGKYSFNEINAK
jgi:hypothetical protein